jgi:uncharacterized membrane protein YcgQ (UPF0703/DUF1980 family)
VIVLGEVLARTPIDPNSPDFKGKKIQITGFCDKFQ